MKGRVLSMRKEGKGFTLTEVMTVLAIVSLLTAIAIPNLLRAKINANEAAAQATLGVIASALEDYYIVQTPFSYPGNLNVLKWVNPPYLAKEITDSSTTGILEDIDFSSSPKFPAYKGYIFRYRPNPAIGGIHHDYSLYALPKTEGSSGVRYFVLDTSRMVRETDERTATGSFGE